MAVIGESAITIEGPIQPRRGTRAALEASDYIPASGEIIIATDTGEIRIGDGVHSWSELKYAMQGLIESLLSRIENLEAQAEMLNEALEYAVEPSSDDDIEEMLDTVFTSNPELPDTSTP